MRRLLLCLLPALCLGCFVLEELEAADELVGKSTQGARAEEKAEAAKTSAAEQEKAKRERIRQWWDGARTLDPDPDPPTGDQAFVQCHLRGTSFLTRQADCLSRGGRPGAP